MFFVVFLYFLFAGQLDAGKGDQGPTTPLATPFIGHQKPTVDANELDANEYEIEDLKPCIADLDLKNTIKVKKATKKNGEPRKKRVRRKKGSGTQFDCYSYIVHIVKMVSVLN